MTDIRVTRYCIIARAHYLRVLHNLHTLHSWYGVSVKLFEAARDRFVNSWFRGVQRLARNCLVVRCTTERGWNCASARKKLRESIDCNYHAMRREKKNALRGSLDNLLLLFFRRVRLRNKFKCTMDVATNDNCSLKYILAHLSRFSDNLKRETNIVEYIPIVCHVCLPISFSRNLSVVQTQWVQRRNIVIIIESINRSWRR